MFFKIKLHCRVIKLYLSSMNTGLFVINCHQSGISPVEICLCKQFTSPNLFSTAILTLHLFYVNILYSALSIYLFFYWIIKFFLHYIALLREDVGHCVLKGLGTLLIEFNLRFYFGAKPLFTKVMEHPCRMFIFVSDVYICFK